MLGKTHFSVGMAAGIAICRPQTMPMLIAGAGLAAFGGTICDIDVETSDAHEQVDRMLVVAVIMVAAVVVMDFIFRVGIYRRLMANSNIARVIIGSLAFLMICAFGKEQSHRSFMHSFLALAMLSICVYIIFPDMTPYFILCINDGRCVVCTYFKTSISHGRCIARFSTSIDEVKKGELDESNKNSICLCGRHYWSWIVVGAGYYAIFPKFWKKGTDGYCGLGDTQYIVWTGDHYLGELFSGKAS